MDAEPRTRGPRSDTERNRRLLVDAARIVFSNEGIAAPLDHVATTAGLSRATLYRHFPDRSALWDAVLLEPLERIHDLVEESRRLSPSVDGLVAYLWGIGEQETAATGIADLMTTRFVAGSRLAGLRERIQDGIDDLVRRAREDGGVRADFEESDLALLTISLTSLARSTRDVAPDAWRRLVVLALEGVVQTGVASPLPRTTALRRNQVWRAFSSPRGRSSDR